MAFLDLDRVAARQRARFFLPAGDLLDAALGIFIERNAELLDQVLAAVLDEPGRIFGEVLRTFGDEIAKPGHHLVAHLVGAARVPVAGLGETAVAVAGKKVRIEVTVAAVGLAMLELQEERHVVDAGGAVADLADGNVEVARQLIGRALHRMAQANLTDGG